MTKGENENDLNIIKVQWSEHSELKREIFESILKFYIVDTMWNFKFFIFICSVHVGSLIFRRVSRGHFWSKIWSVIYRRNRERTSFPYPGSDFSQVSASNCYRRFSNLYIFMVKSGIWMLQMKLQLGIMIFHPSKTSPIDFRMIW